MQTMEKIREALNNSEELASAAVCARYIGAHWADPIDRRNTLTEEGCDEESEAAFGSIWTKAVTITGTAAGRPRGG
jgi:hypothetical protein